MQSIIQQIEDWIKGILVSGIMDNLTSTFSSVNDQVGQIASNVGQTPSNFMPQDVCYLKLFTGLTEKTLQVTLILKSWWNKRKR